MLLRNQRGLGAIGATIATALGMTLLAGGSKLYVNTKASEAATNEMRKRGEVVQQNASAFTDKLLRGGVIEEQNGAWQLQGGSPAATWSFSPAVIGLASAPVISFNFCDPAKILSGLESVESCSPTVLATTTILGREPAGKVKLSNYSLITKAAKQMESRSASRVSGVPECREYNGTALVARIFRSVLGRDPSNNELENIMPCVASGNLKPWDLESNSTGFCGGLVSGLRASPEYDVRREAVYGVFRSNVGRMPGPGDAISIAAYMGQLNVPTANFIPALQGVSTAIRTDYSLGTQPHQPHLLNDLYEIIAQGAFLPINVATNAYLPLLASGNATLSTVVALMRQASWYRSENPGIDPEWAKRSEAVNFIYHALTGKHLNQLRLEWGLVQSHPFEIANFYGYHAWLMDVHATDSTQNGYQWMAKTFQSGNTIDFESLRVLDAGVCAKAVPRPQAVILSSGNINAQGVASTVMTPGYALQNPTTHAFVRFATAAEVTLLNSEELEIDNACRMNGTTTPVYECKNVFLPPTPGVARTFTRQALAFGYFDQWQYDEADTFVDIGLVNPASRHLTGLAAMGGFQSISSGSATVNIGAGGATLSAIAGVSGPGGTNQFSLSNNVPAQKESCAYGLSTRGSAYLHGPTAWTGQRVVYSNVQIPAVPIETTGFEYFPEDADKRILHIAYNGFNLGVGSQVIDRGRTPTFTRTGFGASPSFENPGAGALTRYKYGSWGANCCTFPTPQEPVNYTKNGITYRIRNVTTNVRGSADCHFSYMSTSPLVLDLGAEGIEYTETDHPVLFDLDGEGKRGYFWIKGGRNTPFLVLDKDGDHQISSIHEMFGNKTRGPDGNDSENGFLSLAKYDSDRDRKITANDVIFDRLALWSDENENGLSEPGELKPITQSGIKAIDLAYLNQIELNDNYGNRSNQRSIVEMYDGSLRMIFDIWLTNLGE